jgi:putative ABC transport system ATP-binding protein
VIYLDGLDITFLPERERAIFIRRLFQNIYLGSCLSQTVRENLAKATLKEKRAGFKLGTKAFPNKIVAKFLQPLNLKMENLLDIPIGALSEGQRQIISFIMSLLKAPKIMLLDEPTAALDPKSATQLLSFAKNYAQQHKTPILLITPDPLVAKHLGNRLWILKEGSI